MNNLDFTKIKNFGARDEIVISKKTIHKVRVYTNILIYGGHRSQEDIESSVGKKFNLLTRTGPHQKRSKFIFSREDA